MCYTIGSCQLSILNTAVCNCRSVAFNWILVKRGYTLFYEKFITEICPKTKSWSKHMTWNSVLPLLLYEVIRFNCSVDSLLGLHPLQVYQSSYSGVSDIPGVFSGSFISPLACILPILLLVGTSTTEQATQRGLKLKSLTGGRLWILRVTSLPAYIGSFF